MNQETVNVNGRTYQATKQAALQHTAALLISKGFEPCIYTLSGRRGALKLAYRRIDGRFVVVA